MKRRHITAFYLETLILIIVFIGVILVLVRVFGISREKSETARLLTGAVSLSENAAEAVAASASPEEAAALLNENGNAVVLDAEAQDVAALFNENDNDNAADAEAQAAAAPLNENFNAAVPDAAALIAAYYNTDQSPSPEGSLCVLITWEPEETLSGTLVSSQISVWYREEREPLYTLNTAVFIQDRQ